MKQDVIPSEAQVQDRSRDAEDDIPDDDLRRAMELSKQQMYHDPMETPDTGGSAASAGPSMVSTPKERSQQVDESAMTKKTVVLRFRRCSIKPVPQVEALQAKMRGAAFTMEEMNRLEYLQPVVNKCRKQMGPLQAKAQGRRRILTAGRHDQTKDGRPRRKRKGCKA